ncbi:MAG: phenylalanine--tRNA ligase subunit beta, partial [Synergistaceae bacterium]|nr:phenylalanine--tRNA ligase subunit beta [Synergistaceae bacterium]
MLVSWELLKDLIELDVAPERAADRLTAAGAEVEAIHRPIARMRGIVVAKIDRLEAHPTDARLYVAHIDAGAGSRVCITSATNVKAGDRVLYASPGSTLPDGTELGTRAFSGVESEGMMLS